jgi:arylsulfatase A-like enzyme
MQFLLFRAVALLAVAIAVSTARAAPPNIVLIVSDDQGYHDLGCFGSDEVLTPNLDRLAREGVRLTDFYVAWPACTPSRASLLSGRYPQRNGVYDMIRNEAPDYGYRYTPERYAVTFERIGGMDTREVLLPAMLKRAGYKSAIFGKWDLGSLKRYLPGARGFDEFYGFVNTGIDYFTHERYGVPSMYRDEKPTTEDKGTYCTDLFRREAVRFVKENHDGPFFLYLPFNAPHGASNLDPKIRTSAQATDAYRARYPELQKKAAYVRGKVPYGDQGLVQNRAMRRLEFVASITSMDDAIGEVLGLLDEHGIADNTIVIFFSDNGGPSIGDNRPLRGKKSEMFEGGIRVPCIVRFPKRIAGGRTSSEFLTSLDLVPTLLNLCGVKPPDGLEFDGYDVMAVLAGEVRSPRTEMFWQRRGDQAARVGHWKWVESDRGNGLFDLSKDIGETTDLSASNPEKLAELTAAFARWRAAMDAAEPRGPFRDY